MNRDVKQNEQKCKILLCGPASVGKTSLIKIYVKSAFPSEYKLTVGVDVYSKEVEISRSEKVILSIWDIGGQERFEFIRNSFYRGAIGALLVFDLSRPGTFDEMDKWVEEIQEFTGTNPVIVLVGNKIDIIPMKKKRRNIDPKYTAYAKRHQFYYLETSAKDGINVEKVFLELTQRILQKIKV
jgi:small GTP-binding protein